MSILRTKSGSVSSFVGHLTNCAKNELLKMSGNLVTSQSVMIAVHKKKNVLLFVFKFFPFQASNELCVCSACSFFSEYKPPRFHGNKPCNSAVLEVALEVN